MSEAHSRTALMLAVEGLTAGYGQIPVIRDVSLTLPDNCVACVLGPNGAGKTTLLRCLFSHADIFAGRISVFGKRIDGRKASAVSRLGVCYVSEGRAIFKGLSVEDNLRVFADTLRLGDKVAARVYDVFPILAERRKQLAGTLSGGEQQMLALSRALVKNFRLLVIDELSLGLAPRIVDQLFGVLPALAGDGRSILLVEQYADRALALADFAFVLRKGEMVFVGEASELRGRDLLRLYASGE